MSERIEKPDVVDEALKLLDEHYRQFQAAKPFADKTSHPVPSDTRAWSQMLVSLLTGIPGLGRKKGSDLADGSDVKAANVWSAIDTPRFNGCIPAGRKSEKSKRSSNVSALNAYPHMFFVMWDHTAEDALPRCRVWCVRPPSDPVFRSVSAKWYKQFAKGKTSTNFQLYPPRNRDTNVIRNECGNMEFPLLFCATRRGNHFVLEHFVASAMTTGKCSLMKG